MSCHCCTAFSRWIIDYFQFELNSDEAYQRIESEASHTQPADRRDYWDQISVEPTTAPALVAFANSKFDTDKQKRALILGRVYNFSVVYLLKLEWKVTAIDSSVKALEKLQNLCNISQLGELGDNLMPIHGTIEEHAFPQKVDLIFAYESLSYSDPRKFKRVWKRAHEALNAGGRIVGNFRLKPASASEENAERTLKGAWYVTKPCVEALLKDLGYVVERCEQEESYTSPTHINFIARKV
ncbi:MAG: class I SAM-dependent methyltransferase [Verrucomicrobia bacterium]|nr:class I SAM-dependent methyltransferase [Verrucomicrobiota bacterium]